MARANPHRASILSMAARGMKASEISRVLDVPRQTVQYTLKRGTIQDRPRAGRPVTVTTARAVKIVRKRIQRDPGRSMKKMAKELGMSEGSMRKICHEKLLCKSYRLKKRQGLSDQQKKNRRIRGKLLLARAATGEHLRTLYTDEKIFTIERAHNSQNDRILAPDAQAANDLGRIVERNHHPLGVMTFAGITADKRTPLFFVPSKAKVNGKMYKEEILKNLVKPWADAEYPNGDLVFQQDGAPAHTARLTQDWLKCNIPGFIPKEEWPANSPDCNPMDYCVWSILEAEACAKKHRTIEELKRTLTRTWEAIPQETLRAAVEDYPRRLKVMLKAKGGHFE